MFADLSALKARQLRNREEHVKPLGSFVERLRVAHPATEFPDFDPADGGVHADILFLFEKPGPKTSISGGGSGFISRDNDDLTAAATNLFMRLAGLENTRGLSSGTSFPDGMVNAE